MPARASKIIYISLGPLGPILFQACDSTCIVTSHELHKRHNRSAVVEDDKLRTGVNGRAEPCLTSRAAKPELLTQMALRQRLLARLFAGASAVSGLTRCLSFFRFLCRGFPASTLEQAETEANGNSEVGGLVFSEDGEVDADDAA